MNEEIKGGLLYDEIKKQARQAVTQLLAIARPQPDDIIIIGCSSSEIMGERIGTGSSVDAAQAVFDGLYPVLRENGLFLAAQCCEHLNRAVILEGRAVKLYGLPCVNVVPQPKAGGSFATAVYKGLEHAVAVEDIRALAAAGMDIGGTLIGMHLRHVAVPVRLDVKQLGEAHIICARTRPKFIGGSRAVYDESLL